MLNNEMNIKSRTNIVLWLFSGCFLIFAMVVVGGITRLTGSGLSITKWDVVTGTIPPLNDADWQKEFDHYKETPQFKHINTHFEIEDFKQIYFWEYVHRLLGRFIGIVFLIPFLWFLFTKQLNRTLMFKCLLLFGMGALQGFIGWYMVKSGLVNIPSVSHLRLALHLFTAFMTFGLTFWFTFELIHTEKFELGGWQKKLFSFALIVFVLVSVQIVFGAFTAGLKAGYVYNTWPLMGDKLIADSVFFGVSEYGWKAFVNNISGVQVVHRYLAYVVVLAITLLYIYVRKKQKTEVQKLLPGQLQALNIVIVVVLFQFVLGVLTLLFNVPVYLGVLHQIGAFFLFASVIYLLHRLSRQSLQDVAKYASGK
jgi:heme a synthase